VHQEDQQTEPVRSTPRPVRAEPDRAGAAPSGTPEQQRLLALQRLAGNQAVVHALGHRPGAHRNAPGADHAPGLTVQRVLRNDQRSNQLMAPRSDDQEALEAVFPRNPDGTFAQFPNPVGPPRQTPLAAPPQNSVAPPRQEEDERGRRRGHDPRDLGRSLVRGVSRALSRIGHRRGEAASPAPAVPPVPAAFEDPERTGAAVSDNAAYVEPAEWVRRINPRRDEGGRLGPYRRNCIDTARSFLASWSGNPTVAAGMNTEGVESEGNKRTAEWLNAGEFRDPDRFTLRLPDVEAREIRTSWQAVHRVVLDGGHGTSALVVFHPYDPTGEREFAHAVCAVNYRGQVLWVDAQRGTVSTTPMYEGTNVLTIVLDPQFTPVQPPTADVGISLD
jgi:hypothetical protein